MSVDFRQPTLKEHYLPSPPPRPRFEFPFPAPGQKVTSSPLWPFSYGYQSLPLFRELPLGSLVSDCTLELASVSLLQALQAPTGLRPLCFHCPALPRHKSHYLLMDLCVQAGQTPGWGPRLDFVPCCFPDSSGLAFPG